ncbi:DUF202 domain-containing protein [Nitratireductor sp. XY-223]|uniref:DUF202 domain-containing protein n=1 Tax=Nitratireductor sp. XY-223 TaxID=2561926 RepID=UPI0010AA3355|nr:DUF202 domain-containing protein [Nitratireductor sp. XY-223]
MDMRERRSVENLVLAIVRTELANRRTLLSYLNTSIALFVSGAGLLKLSGSQWLEWVGIALMPISVAVAVIGIVDYRILRRSIEAEKQRAAADDTGT